MDPKILVKNTSIVISNYHIGDMKSLENTFSIYDRVTHKALPLGMYYDKEKEKLYIPRAIDLYLLEKWFGEKAVIDHNYDEFDNTHPITIHAMPRNDRQKEALRFMLCEREYEKNKYRSQFAVNLPTGAGKTYVSIATASYLEIKSIIITYSNGWLQQWKERIQEYTDIKNNQICWLSSSSMDLILSGKSRAVNNKIYLVTHSTLQSFGTSRGWEAVGEVFKKLKIGIKFIDEAHLNFANMAMIDFFTNTWRTYYVTATPARSSEDENRIYQLYMKHVPSIDLFDEDNDPHTHYIAIKYNSRPTPQQQSDCLNAYGLSQSAYTNYVVQRPNFLKAFRIVLDMVIKTGQKALFYIATNEAIMIVKEWLEVHYPELRGRIGVYTSINTKEQKLIEKEKMIILSTTKSAGAAEDIGGLKFTVVLAEPFKSEVIARQTLGRTRANNTFYIELVDTGFVQTKRYYFTKLPIMQKYALSCKHMTYSELDLDNKANSIIDHRTFKPAQAIMQYAKPVEALVQNAPKLTPALHFFEE